MNELLGIQFSIPTSVLLGFTLASVIGFVGSLVIIPIILIRLPADYFDTRFPRHWMRDHHPVLRVIGLIIKNVVGFVFILAGFIMLFLPGQGLLTILIGISLIDFPGKLELEAKIIGFPKILNTINNLRHKFGKPPLTVAITDHDKKNTIDLGD
jgi:Putative transmembrane protein (PGPGW)